MCLVRQGAVVVFVLLLGGCVEPRPHYYCGFPSHECSAAESESERKAKEAARDAKWAENKAKLDRYVQSLIGGDVNQVISRLGPPTSTYKMPNENTLFSWVVRGAPNTFNCTLRTTVNSDGRILDANYGNDPFCWKWE